MNSPFTGKEMSIVKKCRAMSFRKDEFKVLFHTYKCEDTGEQFEDDAFSQLNYNQLVNQYREKYNIPFPEQILSIREKYKLSATKMSEILGFGTNGYRQYEGGEVPSQSNANLIQLASDPKEFNKLVDLCTSIDQNYKKKIHKIIDELLEEQKIYNFQNTIENYILGTSLPSKLTGHKMPNFKKFSEMIVFFTEKLEPWKTKMNKLLFYADFIMHKQSGFSISGTQYRAITLGPVPNNFNSIFEYLVNKGELTINYIKFSNGREGEQFKPTPSKTFDKKMFTESELQVLEAVAERFEKTSTNDIIDISHKEKAWMDNKSESKLIDYNYSFDLN